MLHTTFRRCLSFAAFSAFALFTACTTTPNHAPVTDRSAALQAPAPALPPAPPSGPGYYTVKRGDTLYGIALQYGQDYRQLALWNNLDASYHIHVDQVLRVVPPDATNASAADVQAAGVAAPTLIERPLGAAGPLGANGPSGVALSAAASADVPDKTGPLATKRPYSDAALAELSKPDSELVASAPVAAANVAPAASDQAAAEDDEAVGWIWPAQGPEIAGFSEVGNKGVNIAGKSGAPVYAAGAGKVLYVGNGVRGYGNLVVVQHNPTYISVYAHNSKILVAEQALVKKGQKIAEMGDSDADQVELHFEIRRQGKPVDPMKYLPAR